MYYLLLMTFAGSLLFVGYLCWKRLFGQKLPQSMLYKALWMVLLVYIIPWAWLKKIYKNIFYIFSRKSYEATALRNELSVNIADISTASEAYRTQDYRILLLVSRIWIAVAVIMMSLKLIYYFRKRRQFLSVANRCSGKKTDEIIWNLRKEFHCKRKVEVFEVPGQKVTFTIGVIKPLIFLQTGCEGRELELILRHEMVHIVRKDMLTKVVLEWACCLHWFNILVYLFRKEFNIICENACDENVVCKFDIRERTEYARLLIKNIGEVLKATVFSSAMATEGENIKERIRVIMTKKKMKVWEKVMAAGTFAVLVFVNSLTALAYPNVFYVDNTTAEVAVAVADGDNCWAFSEAATGYDGPVEEIVYDEQFIDEAGQIYPAGNQSQRVICFKHNIVSGYFQNHLKDDNGGCTVRTYESTRCTKCNTIWIGDLVSTTTYVNCPH